MAQADILSKQEGAVVGQTETNRYRCYSIVEEENSPLISGKNVHFTGGNLLESGKVKT